MNEKPKRTGVEAGVFTVPDAVGGFGFILLLFIAPAAQIVIEVARQDNPRFDENRFRRACGVWNA